MRIDQLLNEDGDPIERLRELQQYLNTHCKEIYHLCKESGHHFIHSGDVLTQPLFQVVKNKEDRKPTDTAPRYHAYVDHKLEEKFGVKFRSNALFVYPHNKKVFGSNNYWIFPVDGSRMTTAPGIRDLYMSILDASDFKHNPAMAEIVDKFRAIVLTKEQKEEVGFRFSRTIDKMIFLKKSDQRLAYSDPNYPNSGEKVVEVLHEEFPEITGDMIERLGHDELVNHANEMVVTVDREIIKTLDEILDKYKLIEGPSDIPSKQDVGESEVMIHASEFVFVDMRAIRDTLTDNLLEKFREDPIEFLYNGTL